MSKPFDMELFLGGMLTGSHATRQRHLRQANHPECNSSALAVRDTVGVAAKALDLVSQALPRRAQ